jgi:small-conductance mechanosensitive channel
MLTHRLLATLVILAVIAAFRVLFGALVSRKLGKLRGHGSLTNSVSIILATCLVIILLYIWDIIPMLLSLFAALGVIGGALAFTLKDIWISNVLAGISLIGSKLIDIGSEIEVDGKRGRVIEMTLTTTKLRTTDGRIIMVPNRKFKEDIVTIIKAPK